MAGQLSKGVTLGYRAAGSTGSYTTLANLQEFPDLLGEPENVDVTTLADSYRHYIPGIQDVGGNMAFTFLYTKSGLTTVNGLTGQQDFQLTIPAAGTESQATITWTGYMRPSIVGKGVNDAMQFTVNITADSDFTIA